MSGRELGFTWSRLIKLGADKSLQADSNKASYTVNMGQNLQNIQKVAVAHVLFRNNFYNVLGSGDDQNNYATIVRLSDSKTGTITIPEGWYNIATFMTAVQGAINTFLASSPASSPDTVALTQDSKNFLVTMTVTNGSDPGPHGFSIIGPLINLMGFRTVGTTPLSVTTTATGSVLPSLGGLTEVYLVSRNLAPGNSMDEDGDQSNVLLPIPITVPFGFLQVFECKQEVLCNINYLKARNLQEIDFALCDRDLHPLDLRGSNLKVDLKVWTNVL